MCWTFISLRFGPDVASAVRVMTLDWAMWWSISRRTHLRCDPIWLWQDGTRSTFSADRVIELLGAMARGMWWKSRLCRGTYSLPPYRRRAAWSILRGGLQPRRGRGNVWRLSNRSFSHKACAWRWELGGPQQLDCVWQSGHARWNDSRATWPRAQRPLLRDRSGQINGRVSCLVVRGICDYADSQKQAVTTLRCRDGGGIREKAPPDDIRNLNRAHTGGGQGHCQGLLRLIGRAADNLARITRIECEWYASQYNQGS